MKKHDDEIRRSEEKSQFYFPTSQCQLKARKKGKTFIFQLTKWISICFFFNARKWSVAYRPLLSDWKKKFLEWWFHFHLSQTASAIGTFPDYAAEKKRPQLFFGHRLWKVFSSGFDSSSCIFFSLQHSYGGSYFLPFSNFTFRFFFQQI